MMSKNSDVASQKSYNPPTIEVIGLVSESPVLSASNETFNTQQDYDGDWA